MYVLIFCYSLLSLQALICLVDKKSGEKSKTRPRFVKQDQVCIARLRTAGTICLETFKDFPQMGRFTLRDEGMASTDTGEQTIIIRTIIILLLSILEYNKVILYQSL